MNGKKAKQLRRTAEAATTGMPARRTLQLTPFISSPHTERKLANIRAPRTDSEGKLTGGWGRPNYSPITAVNDPESTRGLYRHLKRVERVATIH